MNKCQFEGMTDLELVLLQKEARKGMHPTDKAFLTAILTEMKRRQAR